MGCSPPCSGAYPARRTAQGIKRLHWPESRNDPRRSWQTVWRCLLEGLEARPRGCRGQRPRSGGQRQAPPRRSPAPAHPVLPHLPGGTGGRMDAPERTAGHPLGQPSKMDTLAWPAGRRERTPRRTATATDRMLDACSSGRLQSFIRAGWPGSTNDERLQSALGGGPRPGIRVGVQPSRAGASIPTAMVRVMVKRLARQSPSRPGEHPAWPHDVIRRFLEL